VRAAHELFSQIGFDATKTEMIAERAGISRQTLYEYYKAKEDLYSAALAIEAKIFDRAVADIDPRASPDLIITRIIHAMFDAFVGTSRFSILDVKLHDRIGLPKIVVETGKRHLSQIEAAMRRGKEAGIFSRSADAQLFQASVIMVLAGFTFSNDVVEPLVGVDCRSDQAVAEWKARLTTLLLRSIAETTSPPQQHTESVVRRTRRARPKRDAAPDRMISDE